MNRIFLLILISIFTVSIASAQTTFLKKLKKGEKQIPRKNNVLQLLEVGNWLFLGNGKLQRLRIEPQT